MTRSKQLLGAVSSIALVALSASPALAEGTTAGQDIVNNVSVTFDVGGVTQGAVIDSDTFTVDRKVNVTVTEVGNDTTEVAPGQLQAAIRFEVTNDSNDAVDFALTAEQSAADDFDITNIKFYVDNGDGIFNPADDLEVTYLDEMAADETRTVFIVGDIPTGVVTGDTADVALVADAHAASGTAGALGAELTDTAGANTAGIDTVLADGAGDVDAANRGRLLGHRHLCRRGGRCDGGEVQPYHQRSGERREQPESNSGCSGRILHRRDQCRRQRDCNQC